MTPALRASSRYWIAGLILAGAGVVASRLVAPVFPIRTASAIAVAGEITALVGLGVIMTGIKRRIARESALHPGPNTPTP